MKGYYFSCALFFMVLSAPGFLLPASAQDQPEKKRKKFNFPGTIAVEVGINLPVSRPTNFSVKPLGSRTLNIYYQYDFVPLKKIAPSISFVAGLGLSLEHFSIADGYTLNVDDNARVVMSQRQLSIRRSIFATNYVDIPIEIRYTANPNDLNRSFRIGVGFRSGILMNAHTKITYAARSGGEAKEKLRRDWFLNTFRFGPFVKIGVGNVSAFFYYNITPIFASGRGPLNTNMNNLTIGLAFNGF